MITFTRNIKIAILFLAALLLPTSVLATNGYFAHGYGTKNKGLVGAGVALPQDAMAAATNPAGMVMVGNRMDLGAAIFSPSPRTYEVTPIAGGLGINGGFTGSDVESQNDFFLIPHFAYNKMLDSDSSIGVTVYGNGGMNTEWHIEDTPFGIGTFQTGTTGVNLMQLFINTTYARKIDDKSAWGASLILAHQRFEMYGVNAFAGLSNDNTKLSNNGVDSSSGFGVKLGIQGEVSPGVTLAASYQTEIDMGEFDDYAGLFAEKGDFDIPATLTVGLAWETSPKTVLVFDVQQIMYSDIPAVGGDHDENITACMAGGGGGGAAAGNCLGGDNGIGFAWDDMTIVKLGYQWESGSDMVYRVGVSHGGQPIPEEAAMFNVVAPAVVEDHLTFGFTKDLGNKSELNFALMHALKNKLEGTNALGAPAGQDIDLEMSQYEIEASWGKSF